MRPTLDQPPPAVFALSGQVIVPRGPIKTDPRRLEAALESAWASPDPNPFCPACGYRLEAHLEVTYSDAVVRETCPSEAEARAFYGDR